MSRIVTFLDKIEECAERPDWCRNRESEKAFAGLQRLPSSEVLPLVLERIQSGPIFQGGWERNAAYGVLVSHRGETEAEVREQLLAGLTEPDRRPRGILNMCAAALSRVNDEMVRRTAVNKLISQWDFPAGGVAGHSPEVTEKLWRLASVIRGLGYFGKDAQIAIDDIEDIFRNADLFFEYKAPDKDPFRTQRAIELDYQGKARASIGRGLKAAALDAVFRIGGPARVLRLLDGVDPLGREILLAFFGWQASERKDIKGAFDGNPVHQQAIRKFVIESLTSSEKDVRSAAFQAMTPAFGTEVVIIRSPEDYEWNPTFIRALKYVAANDPDPGLRQRAARGLQQLDLDRAVQRILRRRGEEKENRDETPRTP